VEHSGGQVYGVELIPELVSIAKKNLENADRDLLDRGIVSVVRADGWKGLPNHAPFHFIHVGAAAEHIPDALLEQVKINILS
jgi:protein-L-isoaspartate(D-aspartate) O-methyltransferase